MLQRGEWKPVQSVLPCSFFGCARELMKSVEADEQPDSLQSMIPALVLPPSPSPSPTLPVEQQLESDAKSTAAPTSFFASGDETDSESEPDVNPSKAWAELMVELDAARMAAQRSGAGKKKGKGGVDTPETRRLKERTEALEALYVFNKKEAGEHFHQKESAEITVHKRYRISCAKEQSASKQPRCEAQRDKPRTLASRVYSTAFAANYRFAHD